MRITLPSFPCRPFKCSDSSQGRVDLIIAAHPSRTKPEQIQMTNYISVLTILHPLSLVWHTNPCFYCQTVATVTAGREALVPSNIDIGYVLL